jgi:hypothetical protein
MTARPYLSHTSTRRFLSRPASVSLQATGSAGPNPRVSISFAYCRSPSLRSSASLIALARSSDSAMLRSIVPAVSVLPHDGDLRQRTLDARAGMTDGAPVVGKCQLDMYPAALLACLVIPA